jgi:hypothetical protein
VAGCCECGDEPSGSCATELVSLSEVQAYTPAHNNLLDFSTIILVYLPKSSRVAQSVQCLATGWTTGRSRFDLQQRRKDFSSSLCVQTGSGAHPASCTTGTGGPFPGANARPGRDADLSSPSTAEVENE